MNDPILCGLLMFAVAGTILQWCWIWHFIKRISEVEEKYLRELAKLSEQIPADHAKDACHDAAPKV